MDITTIFYIFVCQRMKEEFKKKNVILKLKTMETNQEVMTLPRIGEAAPEFKAVTTQGLINFPSDYMGKWVILFSHPADFTPVCTSEFMTFASMEAEFKAFNFAH